MIGSSIVRSIAGQVAAVKAAVLAVLAASSGAGLVGFIQSGAGAVVRSLLSVLLDRPLSIKDFGANGDGTPEGAAFVLALTNAIATGRSIYFPAGSYNFSDLATPTVTGVVDLVGEGRERVTITGAAGLNLVVINGGSTFKARGLKFDTWRAVAKLASNVGGTAFALLQAEACWFNAIEVSPISDRTTPADGGITELRFSCNLCTNIGQVNALNSAGLRLDSAAIYSGFVTENEIRTVGGAAYSGQKDGISLGAVTVTPLSSLYVAGNRIYDVQNSSGEHLSGITVFGRHTRVVDNDVNTVKSASGANVDQYGIYTKSSYSTIRGNTLVDAGGNAACIMTKGSPNDLLGEDFNANDSDNVIADNTVLIATRWASIASYVGITTYNQGMDIHDNIVEGVTLGIVRIGQVVAGGAVGRDLIHHNKIRNLLGTAAKRAVGIQVTDANKMLIESNELRAIGSGIEPAAYGVLMENSAGGTFSELTIRGNTVETLSAASASNARAVFLSFDAAGTMTDVSVEGNNLKGGGRGIQLALTGTYSKIHVRNNRMDAMSVSWFDFSGTAPADDSMLEGNTFNGADALAIASGTVAPTIAGANNLRLNNAGPTVVSNFSRGYGTQLLRLEISDAGATTIANNANIKLAGAVNWTPVSGGMLTLRRTGGVFKEISRAAY